MAKRKQQVQQKKNPCEGCDARCCHDLAMMIIKPRTRADIDQVSWYLHFDTVQIFIRNHRWYLLIKGRCIYLTQDNRCGIYDRRSERCRRHSPDTCERYTPYYDTLLTTPEELRSYLKSLRAPVKRRRARKR